MQWEPFILHLGCFLSQNTRGSLCESLYSLWRARLSALPFPRQRFHRVSWWGREASKWLEGSPYGAQTRLCRTPPAAEKTTELSSDEQRNISLRVRGDCASATTFSGVLDLLRGVVSGAEISANALANTSSPDSVTKFGCSEIGRIGQFEPPQPFRRSLLVQRPRSSFRLSPKRLPICDWARLVLEAPLHAAWRNSSRPSSLAMSAAVWDSCAGHRQKLAPQPASSIREIADLVALVNGTCSECRQLGFSDACSRPSSPRRSLGSAVQEVFDRLGGRESELL